MTKTLLSIGLAFALLLTSGAAFADFKVAYVDLQEAIGTVNEGKSIKKKLERAYEKKKKELEAAQDELVTLREELEKQGPMMKEDVRRKKLTDFQEKVAKFQEAYLGSQKELAGQEQELTKPMLQKMVKIIEEMAKDLGYDLVVERGAILYAQSNMDLTDELVKRYNTKHTSK
jgi:outer membrane protein